MERKYKIDFYKFQTKNKELNKAIKCNIKKGENLRVVVYGCYFSLEELKLKEIILEDENKKVVWKSNLIKANREIKGLEDNKDIYISERVINKDTIKSTRFLATASLTENKEIFKNVLISDEEEECKEQVERSYIEDSVIDIGEELDCEVKEEGYETEEVERIYGKENDINIKTEEKTMENINKIHLNYMITGKASKIKDKIIKNVIEKEGTLIEVTKSAIKTCEENIEIKNIDKSIEIIINENKNLQTKIKVKNTSLDINKVIIEILTCM